MESAFSPKPPCIDCPVAKAYAELLFNINLNDDESIALIPSRPSGFRDLCIDDEIKFWTMSFGNKLPDEEHVVIDSAECKGPKKKFYWHGESAVGIKLGKVCAGEIVAIPLEQTDIEEREN